MVSDNNLFVLALICYLITGYFSSSYYHPDEHYQIIEFAEYKAGRNLEYHLPWEFAAEIRSTIQPAMLFMVFKALRAVNITDPFVMMVMIRMAMGLVALTIIHLFYKRTKSSLPAHYIFAYALLSHFLWVLPYINVRFSSETASGTCFLLALVLYFSNIKNKFLLIGLVMGFSFLLRFQVAFLCCGFSAWLIFVQKERFRSFALLIMGFLFSLSIGLMIDTWFYGRVTFTPFNYFKVNILQDAASQFGTAPWFFYIKVIYQGLTPLYGIWTITGLILGLLFNRFHYIFWLLIPFIFFHSLIPHKEARFLFPIANLLPLLLIITVQGIEQIFKLSLSNNKYSVVSVVVVSLVNIIPLSINMISPADNGKEVLMQYLKSNERKSVLWCYKGVNPYKPFPFLYQRFFSDINVEQQPTDTIPHNGSKSNQFLVLERKDIPILKSQLYLNHWKLCSNGVPKITLSIKDFFNYGYTDNALFLYQFDPPK